MKRLLPPTFLFCALVLTVILHLLAPLTRIFDWPWRLLGLAPLILGSALNLIADQAFKRRGTTVKPFEKSSFLVTEGVFRISRHPMYLGMVSIVFGAGVLLGTLAPLLVAVALGIMLDRIFIRAEERMMRIAFGDAYGDYTRRTRRWI